MTHDLPANCMDFNLVERLRNPHRGRVGSDDATIVLDSELSPVVARVRELQQFACQQAAKVAELAAEVERLRSAMRKACDVALGKDSDACDVYEILDAALAGKGDHNG